MESKGCSFQSPNPQPLPWLVVSHGKSSRVTSFQSILENRDYITKVPNFSNYNVRSHCEGWQLVTMKDDHSQIHLINFASPEVRRINLPPLDDASEDDECILTAPPTESDCTVALFSFGRPTIRIWRPNQLNWVCQQYGPESDELRDLMVYQGKIYGIVQGTDFGVCEILAEGKFAVKRLGSMPRFYSSPSFTWYYHLVGSCGDIFAVQILGCKRRIQSIHVFKFQETNSEWILVQNIGGNIFFMNTYLPSISCSADNTGLKGNRLYFTRGGSQNLYMFDMEENEIHVSAACPKAINHRSYPSFIMIQP